MTCYGPISTKLCGEWSANASESCAIVRAPSVRVGSVSIPIDVVKCGSRKFRRDSSKGGIFANRGGALRSWEREFVTLTFERYNQITKYQILNKDSTLVKGHCELVVGFELSRGKLACGEVPCADAQINTSVSTAVPNCHERAREIEREQYAKKNEWWRSFGGSRELVRRPTRCSRPLHLGPQYALDLLHSRAIFEQHSKYRIAQYTCTSVHLSPRTRGEIVRNRLFARNSSSGRISATARAGQGFLHDDSSSRSRSAAPNRLYAHHRRRGTRREVHRHTDCVPSSATTCGCARQHSACARTLHGCIDKRLYYRRARLSARRAGQFDVCTGDFLMPSCSVLPQRSGVSPLSFLRAHASRRSRPQSVYFFSMNYLRTLHSSESSKKSFPMQSFTLFQLVQTILSQTKPFSRYKQIEFSNAVFRQNPWTWEAANFKIRFFDLDLPK